MNELPFNSWLTGYIRWRAEAAKILGQRLPVEVTELLREQSALEQLRFESEGWRSDAVGYYYRAKLAEIERLWAEVAKTALNDIAKARCYKPLWARENSHGVAEAVISRSFKVAAELKRQGIVS